jgi:hypothetical protein
MEQLGSHWTDFHEICFFRKSVEKIQASLILDKKKRVLYLKTDVHYLYLAHFLLEREMFQTEAVDKIRCTYEVQSTSGVTAATLVKSQ